MGLIRAGVTRFSQRFSRSFDSDEPAKPGLPGCHESDEPRDVPKALRRRRSTGVARVKLPGIVSDGRDTACAASRELHLSFANSSSPQHELRGIHSIESVKQKMMVDSSVQAEIVPMVCEILDETIARNDVSIQRGLDPLLETFEGDTCPVVSAGTYVKRILKYSKCSTCNLVVGMIYLERLKARRCQLSLRSGNFQRLLLVAIMSAAKFFDDEYFSNKHWAKIGGISLAELNSLELDFLFLLTFNMNVKVEEYKAFMRTLLPPSEDSDEEEPAAAHARTSPAATRESVAEDAEHAPRTSRPSRESPSSRSPTKASSPAKSPGNLTPVSRGPSGGSTGSASGGRLSPKKSLCRQGALNRAKVGDAGSASASKEPKAKASSEPIEEEGPARRELEQSEHHKDKRGEGVELPKVVLTGSFSRSRTALSGSLNIFSRSSRRNAPAAT